MKREICQKARLSRDARFDGQFFTAVKTTKIFCRSICPAPPAQEKNVEYFSTSIAASQVGYRPCLRCRPDSAPGSAAWKGVNTTFERAVRLIDEGILQSSSLHDLANQLGISDRYLRQLFSKFIGVSPKSYALYQQCLFAKQLLHQTNLSVTQIALSSGFNSIRRFNDCFKAQMNLTPSQVRISNQCRSNRLQLKLFYRPPYNWSSMQTFLLKRFIPDLEWVNHELYGRTFEWFGSVGMFTAKHVSNQHYFNVEIELEDMSVLKFVVQNIKRILDVDVNIIAVEENLEQHYGQTITLQSGLRLSGTWNMFEAGIRAILGQQVSVSAARNLVITLVHELGKKLGDKYLFPVPESLAHHDLSFFKMPAARKQALRNLAQHYIDEDMPDNPRQWLELKGIGPWTVDYAKMRGLSDPDVYLGGDLGVKKVIEKSKDIFDHELASPWRSYLTFQLWSQL